MKWQDKLKEFCKYEEINFEENKRNGACRLWQNGPFGFKVDISQASNGEFLFYNRETEEKKWFSTIENLMKSY